MSTNWTTCGGCDAKWTGNATAHCSACHRTFTSVTAFDKHRYYGACREPLQVGLVEHQRGGVDNRYTAWGRPGDDAALRRLQGGTADAYEEEVHTELEFDAALTKSEPVEVIEIPTIEVLPDDVSQEFKDALGQVLDSHHEVLDRLGQTAEGSRVLVIDPWTQQTILEHEAQERHDQRRCADEEHDTISCWCCCMDCHFVRVRPNSEDPARKEG